MLLSAQAGFKISRFLPNLTEKGKFRKLKVGAYGDMHVSHGVMKSDQRSEHATVPCSVYLHLVVYVLIMLGLPAPVLDLLSAGDPKKTTKPPTLLKQEPC